MYSVGVMTRLLPILMLFSCSDYSVVEASFVETFYQPDRGEGIDILWVVDNSATMYEEHDLLMDSADAFIGFVSNSSVDFRLGVISTDMDEDLGTLNGPALNVESSDMVDTFIDQIEMDVAGSRTEKGFEAALIGADPERTPEFARSGADLELVIFSDEDDQSELDVGTFLSALEDQRPSAGVKVHAVVGDPPAGCVSALAAADVGTRYLEAQMATEGRRESICTLDYGAMLARVALDVIGLQTSFALSKVPAVPSIELTVDGIAIHQRMRDGWWYNPGSNTIEFDGIAVPPPGSKIDVTYTEWYGPLEEDDESEEESEE
jgi:hypothetical protein